MYSEYPRNTFLNACIRGGKLLSQKDALPFSPPVECLFPQKKHEASLSCIITAQEDARDVNLLKCLRPEDRTGLGTGERPGTGVTG
jgi:hypothetical protein